MTDLIVKVASYGHKRSGVSKAGNPYIIGEAFVYLPQYPSMPQKFEYFCQNESDVLTSGNWEVPLELNVREDRLDFRLKTREAKLIKQNKE